VSSMLQKTGVSSREQTEVAYRDGMSRPPGPTTFARLAHAWPAAPDENQYSRVRTSNVETLLVRYHGSAVDPLRGVGFSARRLRSSGPGSWEKGQRSPRAPSASAHHIG
jgi:hypothetical protein